VVPKLSKITYPAVIRKKKAIITGQPWMGPTSLLGGGGAKFRTHPKIKNDKKKGISCGNFLVI
jgi:hypothetical protein